MINSRTKGNTYERKLAQEYRELWFTECVTARAESKILDDSWVDLAFTDPFQVQSKCYTNFWSTQIIETLKKMPNNSKYNVVHVKIKNKGELVAMSKTDYYELLQILLKEKIIWT